MRNRITIIGGGLGGLSAAVRVARTGTAVTLVEKNERLGGKLNLWQVPHPRRSNDRPFRFDTGPSMLMLPLVFADLFESAGQDVRDHLSIRRLDPISRVRLSDGAMFEITSDRTRFLEQIRAISPSDVDGVQRLLRHSRKIWDLAGESFLMQPPQWALFGQNGFDPLGSLRALSLPFRIGLFRKFNDVVDRYIRDPRLRHVFYQYATYTGTSPFLAPGTFAVIPHIEIDQGAWHIQGGMYRLAEEIMELCRKMSVDVRLNTAATRIVVDDQRPRVTGITLSTGQTIPSDAVICNADVRWTYEHLIDPDDRPHYPQDKLQDLEPGGSGFVLLLGIEGTYPQLAHHNKFLPTDYSVELRQVFEEKKLPDDPSIYICCATRSDPTLAPDDCENLFVYCAAPPLDGSIDWRRMSKVYRDRIVQLLESRCGLTGLSQRIVVEKTISPQDLADRYNAHAGAIYGLGNHTLLQALMRPPNRDRHLAGLFFAGNTTHPGGGLPLVTLSGKIAANEAMKYLEIDKK